MATLSPSSLQLLLLLTFTAAVFSRATTSQSSIYLSHKVLFSDYDKMLDSFNIYIYTPPVTSNGATVFTTPQESMFYTSLLHSSFVTQDANEANLFFVPFPSSLSTRDVARVVRSIRTDFPFWNRALGADHFYLSAGVASSSDRNVVELKKNAIQISCFPTSSGLFIPHKDITLPPINPSPLTLILPVNDTTKFLVYSLTEGKQLNSSFIEEMNADPEIAVESAPSDDTGSLMKSSRFCLFEYGGAMSWMVEAMASGCVPVVITDRPIQDLPLMDLIKWSEIAVFVGSNGGGARGLKQVLRGIDKGRYDQMRQSGVAASQHLVWNALPQPYDAFHMVVYQLWLRRHTIRYARRERVE